MKERPIIFSTELIPKILDGTKTQTRRVIKNAIYARLNGKDVTPKDLDTSGWIKHCPYGQVDDRFWVREEWASDCICENPKCNGVIYKAGYTGRIIPDKWRPSIHMPRWASRITLEITKIRVERLQEIRTEDIMAEGLESTIPYQGFVYRFKRLWDSLNPKYDWESNPFVWVIEFRKAEQLDGVVATT